MKLILASNNAHKLVEIRAILGSEFDEILSMKEAGIAHETVEDGSTFLENAEKKAREIMEISGCCALADDSGLCVEALGGAPGVYTARYAGGDGHDFEANMDKLLHELEGCEDRRARFRSVVTLILNGQTHVFEGVLEGRIATAKAGCGGFGYDPVFIANGMQCTLAEISEEAKNAISHRGKALRAMAAWLQEHYGK